MVNIPVSYDAWLKLMGSKSKLYDQFGDFMLPQKALLKTIYGFLKTPDRPVVTLSAPPASGKTHVISIVAHYLLTKRVKCCIVVPNAELKTDFSDQNSKVKFTHHPPVLSLAEYLKDTAAYDVAIVDEAHNLRSGYELNSRLVKTFILAKGDKYFEDISTTYLKGRSFAALTLSIEACNDIICKLSNNLKFKQTLFPIRKSLSKWIGFLIITENECKIKLMYADPSSRSLVPSQLLILFSATPLDNRELEFYCNIPKSSIMSYPAEQTTLRKSNVAYVAIKTGMKFDEKLDIAFRILKLATKKSLILLNNSEGCDKWFSYIKHLLPKAMIYQIKSGLSSSTRKRVYDEFRGNPRGILVTSSSVFWEGITIKDLQFLIIPDLPYPEPNLLDIYNGQSFTYKMTVKRRLIQGLGRIGRNPQDTSVAIMLFRPPQLDRVVYMEKASIVEDISALMRQLAKDST